MQAPMYNLYRVAGHHWRSKDGLPSSLVLSQLPWFWTIQWNSATSSKRAISICSKPILLGRHKKSFNSHQTLFLVCSEIWAWEYAKYRSEAVTSVLSLQTLDHPPHLPRLIEFKEHQHWKVISTSSLNGPAMGVNTFILCLYYLQKCLSRVKGNMSCVFPLFGLGGRLLWVDGNCLSPLLRMTQVRTCDLAKCRREAVTCIFFLQKLDHSPHLPRWPVPQTEFKEHQYWKVFHLISQHSAHREHTNWKVFTFAVLGSTLTHRQWYQVIHWPHWTQVTAFLCEHKSSMLSERPCCIRSGGVIGDCEGPDSLMPENRTQTINSLSSRFNNVTSPYLGLSQ